jgi:predicted enzyme related to lactoylglutathione lyase
MGKGFELVVFPAADLDAGKRIYGTLLGTDPYVDSPYYVGFRVDDKEIGLDPRGHEDGAVPYMMVADVPGTLQGLVEAGASVHQEPRDVGGGMLVAVLKDANGNLFGLRQG